MSYPSTISLSTTTLRQVAGLISKHRARIGSPWRRLRPTRQALLVLAHLRNGDTYARLAAGFGVGIATVYRYVREVVDLLAAYAPSLTAAMWRLAWSHHNYAILDGTLIRTNRIAANRPFYSGKHRHHGVNLQGLTDPYGNLMWISDGLPGAIHDTAAARTHRVPDLSAQAGIMLLADSGYFSKPNVELCVAEQVTPYIAVDREAHHLPLRERWKEPEAPGEDADAVEQMKHRLKTPAGRAIYGQRKAVPEPVFGIIKSVMGLSQLLLRGEKAANGEWTLASIAWNLKRMYSLSCQQPRMACATN